MCRVWLKLYRQHSDLFWWGCIIGLLFLALHIYFVRPLRPVASPSKETTPAVAPKEMPNPCALYGISLGICPSLHSLLLVWSLTMLRHETNLVRNTLPKVSNIDVYDQIHFPAARSDGEGCICSLRSVFDPLGFIFSTIAKLRTNPVQVILKRMTDKVPMMFHIKFCVPYILGTIAICGPNKIAKFLIWFSSRALDPGPLKSGPPCHCIEFAGAKLSNERCHGGGDCFDPIKLGIGMVDLSGELRVLAGFTYVAETLNIIISCHCN